MSWHINLIAVTKDRAKVAVEQELARTQSLGSERKHARLGALSSAIAGLIDLMPELNQDTEIEIQSDGHLTNQGGRVAVELSTIRLAK